MKMPSDMEDELLAWNNGAGVPLDIWIAYEGNMKLAVGYSEIFWPRFKLMEDYIVREDLELASLRSFEARCGKGSSSIEATLNHLHIADIQTNGDPETTGDRIRFLFPILKEIYSAKLAWQFPDRPCVVHIHQPDDPSLVIDYQITFWQKKYEK